VKYSVKYKASHFTAAIKPTERAAARENRALRRFLLIRRVIFIYRPVLIVAILSIILEKVF